MFIQCQYCQCRLSFQRITHILLILYKTNSPTENSSAFHFSLSNFNWLRLLWKMLPPVAHLLCNHYLCKVSVCKVNFEWFDRKASGGPDITQSAVYKMIHGLDEPPPPTKPSAQRQASEGTTPHSPPHACSQTLSGSANSLNLEDGSHSNSIPQSARSHIGLGRVPARQGLSFLVLQCLYDDTDQDNSVVTTSSDQVTSGSGSLSPVSSVTSTPGSLSSTPGIHGNIPDNLSDGSLSPNYTNTRHGQHCNRGGWT